MGKELVTTSNSAPSILTAAEFHRLADVPPEAEWFANIQNPNTREAYRRDVSAFMRFVGIRRPEDFHTITRAHVIAWRDTLRDHARRDGAPAGGGIPPNRFRDVLVAAAPHRPNLAGSVSRLSDGSSSQNRIPPCLQEVPPPMEFNGPELVKWVRQHRPDALMGPTPRTIQYLAEQGLMTPRDFAYASLDLDPDDHRFSGVVHDAREVGRGGVSEAGFLVAKPGAWPAGQTRAEADSVFT